MERKQWIAGSLRETRNPWRAKLYNNYKPMLPSAYVYILTNAHNTTLYIGVTTNLRTRLWEHRSKQNKKSFTAQYNLYKLVFFEPFELLVDAIAREKMLKGKSRKFKMELIHKMNPGWLDLSDLLKNLD